MLAGWLALRWHILCSLRHAVLEKLHDYAINTWTLWPSSQIVTLCSCFIEGLQVNLPTLVPSTQHQITSRGKPTLSITSLSSAMLNTVYLLLLVSHAGAAVLQGSPQVVRVINDKLQKWSPSKAQWMPDGKMFAFRQNTSDPKSNFIFSIEPDFRMVGPTNRLDDINAPAGGNQSAYQNTRPPRSDINYVELPNGLPIPSAAITGARGDGTFYDYNSIWLMNAFRLSETSQPNASSTSMIGFVHNEDYWGFGGAVNGCTYKSIGVRYSQDLGLSWTRSVPILTKLVQPPFEQCTVDPMAGTGDLAGMWNPKTQTWVILAQEESFKPFTSPGLVMSVSSDPLGRPGTWTRINPITGQTQPGFIGGNDTLVHPDLDPIKGASPSIIRDSRNGIWHMVYAKWGNGIAYTNSSDLTRWATPTLLPLNYTQHSGTGYPTLIGDAGDALTTNGMAVLYFIDSSKTGLWGRALWSVGIQFSPSTQEKGWIARVMQQVLRKGSEMFLK